MSENNSPVAAIQNCIECGCNLSKDNTSYQDDTCDDCWEEINNEEDEDDE